jgi:hypothetical protein
LACSRIDAVAHRGAIDAGGRSVAVMGTGIDAIYPRENGRLATGLLDGRARHRVPDLDAVSQNFRSATAVRVSPRRPVVEAAERSGSLITARMATTGTYSPFRNVIATSVGGTSHPRRRLPPVQPTSSKNCRHPGATELKRARAAGTGNLWPLPTTGRTARPASLPRIRRGTSIACGPNRLDADRSLMHCHA